MDPRRLVGFLGLLYHYLQGERPAGENDMYAQLQVENLGPIASVVDEIEPLSGIDRVVTIAYRFRHHPTWHEGARLVATRWFLVNALGDLSTGFVGAGDVLRDCPSVKEAIERAHTLLGKALLEDIDRTDRQDGEPVE